MQLQLAQLFVPFRLHNFSISSLRKLPEFPFYRGPEILKKIKPGHIDHDVWQRVNIQLFAHQYVDSRLHSSSEFIYISEGREVLCVQAFRSMEVIRVPIYVLRAN